jgi:hypothetical protein
MHELCCCPLDSEEGRPSNTPRVPMTTTPFPHIFRGCCRLAQDLLLRLLCALLEATTRRAPHHGLWNRLRLQPIHESSSAITLSLSLSGHDLCSTFAPRKCSTYFDCRRFTTLAGFVAYSGLHWLCASPRRCNDWQGSGSIFQWWGSGVCDCGRSSQALMQRRGDLVEQFRAVIAWPCMGFNSEPMQMRAMSLWPCMSRLGEVDSSRWSEPFLSYPNSQKPCLATVGV